VVRRHSRSSGCDRLIREEMDHAEVTQAQATPVDQTTRRTSPAHDRRMGEFEPWARAMVMADEAEARGDANGALDVMRAFMALTARTSGGRGA
jgi:hypothetical protein